MTLSWAICQGSTPEHQGDEGETPRTDGEGGNSTLSGTSNSWVPCSHFSVTSYYKTTSKENGKLVKKTTPRWSNFMLHSQLQQKHPLLALIYLGVQPGLSPTPTLGLFLHVHKISLLFPFCPTSFPTFLTPLLVRTWKRKVFEETSAFIFVFCLFYP